VFDCYVFNHQQPQKASTTEEGSVVSLTGLEGLLPVPPATSPTVPARCCASSSTANPGSSLCGLHIGSTHHSTLDGSGRLLLGPHVAHTEELAGWLSLWRQDSTRQYSRAAAAVQPESVAIQVAIKASSMHHRINCAIVDDPKPTCHISGHQRGQQGQSDQEHNLVGHDDWVSLGGLRTG
jgi:hypothetical protein